MKCKNVLVRNKSFIGPKKIINAILPPVDSFFSPENKQVTLKLLRYSAYMLVLPIAVFYAIWYLIFEADQVKHPYGLGRHSISSSVLYSLWSITLILFSFTGWCGVAAVVVANLVSVAYVRMAWTEEEVTDQQTGGPDQGSKKVRKVDWTVLAKYRIIVEVLSEVIGISLARNLVYKMTW
jgi:hypothetical protein